MLPVKPSYADLSQAILIAHGENLTVGMLDGACLQVLVELGIVVRVGDGMIAATSHGERIYRRLERGEHLAELD